MIFHVYLHEYLLIIHLTHRAENAARCLLTCIKHWVPFSILSNLCRWRDPYSWKLLSKMRLNALLFHLELYLRFYWTPLIPPETSWNALKYLETPEISMQSPWSSHQSPWSTILPRKSHKTFWNASDRPLKLTLKSIWNFLKLSWKPLSPEALCYAQKPLWNPRNELGIHVNIFLTFLVHLVYRSMYENSEPCWILPIF